MMSIRYLRTYLFTLSLIMDAYRIIDERSQFSLLPVPDSSSAVSYEDLSSLNMDLMDDLQDVIFRNYHTTMNGANDSASLPLKHSKVCMWQTNGFTVPTVPTT